MSEGEERDSLLKGLARYDTPTLRRLAALLADRPADEPGSGARGYMAHLRAVADSDVEGLRNSEKSYGNSWKRRGGVDTFHMLARKWDRVEERVGSHLDAADGHPGASPFDIFEHIVADRRADGLIDDVRDLRRYLMLVEAEMVARGVIAIAGGASPASPATPAILADSGRGYLDQLEAVAKADIAEIEDKERSYGGSWKRRGGISAFLRLARKWDRIDHRVATEVEATGALPAAARENVLEHIAADRRAEGVIDDVRGLRQYLLLLEAEMVARGAVEIGTARDNRTE